MKHLLPLLLLFSCVSSHDRLEHENLTLKKDSLTNALNANIEESYELIEELNEHLEEINHLKEEVQEHKESLENLDLSKEEYIEVVELEEKIIVDSTLLNQITKKLEGIK